MYKNPFDGRMNRQNFIYGQLLLLLLIGLVALYIFRDGVTFSNIQNIVPLLVVGTIPQLILTARRLHDINLSGIWSFMILVPYLSLLFVVYISYKTGSVTPNQYGNPDNRTLFNSLRNKEQ